MNVGRYDVLHKYLSVFENILKTLGIISIYFAKLLLCFVINRFHTHNLHLISMT